MGINLDDFRIGAEVFDPICWLGARLEYEDIDASFMDMRGTKVTDQPAASERDQTKRNYLHPVAGSEAAKTGAGLFLTPVA